MLPECFLARMRRLLDEAEFAAFLASYDRPRAVGLRLNPLKADPAPALPFSLEPVPWAAHGFFYDPSERPGLHPWHEAGLYYLQEASAMAPAALLAPRPGERVLDLCAAPGGKSTQLAAMLGGQGLLVCNEINPKRAKILSRNIERLAVPNALVTNQHPAELAALLGAYFDCVLVDAPCSGEGMFRKEQAAVEDWSEETVAMCARRQAEILDSAAALLRPGGRLVYSTCTFAPQEDEGTIDAFLKAHPEFEIVHVDAPCFAPGRPDFIPGISPALADTFRLWPHLLRGDGHYAAVLRKTDGDVCAAQGLREGARFPADYTAFAQDNLPPLPDGAPLLFGQTLYLAPQELPPLRGLKVLRAGLELGRLEKGRFEPAHALALYLKTAQNTVDFPVDSDEIAQYLRGQTLPGGGKGWTLLLAGGLSLGWCKASGGILKNHFPKGLRHL